MVPGLDPNFEVEAPPGMVCILIVESSLTHSKTPVMFACRLSMLCWEKGTASAQCCSAAVLLLRSAATGQAATPGQVPRPRRCRSSSCNLYFYLSDVECGTNPRHGSDQYLTQGVESGPEVAARQLGVDVVPVEVEAVLPLAPIRLVGGPQPGTHRLP